ncbi:MAG: hypothetical protein P1V18_05750 [Candidatus Gracilibacteria bacterium]|nr:hypothetical protein [Candidatus Gracilibacteria bacterium]
METVSKSIKEMFHEHTSRIVEQTAEKFRLYPKNIIWLILFLSYNVLIQGVADVIIKIAGFTPWFEPLLLRVDFLFLTAISVLMGYQALRGMRRRELDVTRNSIAVGLLVEAGLVTSDILHLMEYSATNPNLIYIRSPFIVFTTINFFILVYIAIHFKLFRDKNNKFIIA